MNIQQFLKENSAQVRSKPSIIHNTDKMEEKMSRDKKN